MMNVGNGCNSSAGTARLRSGKRSNSADRPTVATIVAKLEERARARADLGTVVKLAKEAVDILVSASGGSSTRPRESEGPPIDRRPFAVSRCTAGHG